MLNFSIGFVEEGLHDRAITRDLEWGVPLPVEDLGPGKRIYVWFEAVIGYLSASKEWAQLQRRARRRGGSGGRIPTARTYYFIGKDNIPFHTIIWPAILMALSAGSTCRSTCPANQFVTFKGEKASKSEGVGDSVLTLSRALPARRDPLRASPRTCPRRRTPTSPRRSSSAATTTSWSRRGATSSTACWR